MLPDLLHVTAEPLEDGRLLVDFNLAYNPYCAYNDAWSCPLTPPENRLAVAVRAGEMSQQDFFEAESCMHRSHGHCMTMGTASTMASMVEVLGVGLPGNAAIPAVDGRRNVLARMAGRRVVQMVEEDLVLWCDPVWEEG